MALAQFNPRRCSLRTLVLLTILGPPLLALAWFGGIYFWNAAPDLWLLGRYLFFPGFLATLVLIGFSLLYYPRDPAECVRLKHWQAIGLFVLEFLVLWHWLWLSSLLFGWLLIWGDRGSAFMDLVAPAAALLAAIIAGTTARRSQTCLATRNYYQAIFTLTIILLLLALPHWLSRLPRLLA